MIEGWLVVWCSTFQLKPRPATINGSLTHSWPHQSSKTHIFGQHIFKMLFYPPVNVSCLPVVAVDIIQPASLLDNLHSPGDIFPCGETVPPLVFLAIAGFDAAAVSPLLLPAGVVVGALLRLWASQDGAWRGQRGYSLISFLLIWRRALLTLAGEDKLLYQTCCQVKSQTLMKETFEWGNLQPLWLRGVRVALLLVTDKEDNLAVYQ